MIDKETVREREREGTSSVRARFTCSTKIMDTFSA
jgi:hypothetical protein